MNCVQGDLAYVVGANVIQNIGAICEVLGPSGVHGIEWSIRFQSERPLIWGIGGAPTSGRECLCPDAWLRPIRPQSDDAQDESARYLPPVPKVAAPMVTKEAA